MQIRPHQEVPISEGKRQSLRKRHWLCMGEVSLQVSEPRRRPVRRPGPSQTKMYGFCRLFRTMEAQQAQSKDRRWWAPFYFEPPEQGSHSLETDLYARYCCCFFFWGGGGRWRGDSCAKIRVLDIKQIFAYRDKNSSRITRRDCAQGCWRCGTLSEEICSLQSTNQLIGRGTPLTDLCFVICSFSQVVIMTSRNLTQNLSFSFSNSI